MFTGIIEGLGTITAIRPSNRGKRLTVDADYLLDQTKIGDSIAVSGALRLSDRIDGHLVSGHIDGVGSIKQRKKTGNATIVVIGVPELLSRYMITKGSVAVDGISLTINNRSRDCFDVSIIPHTEKLTTIGFKKVGDYVNIETDMIGKYVENFIAEKSVNAIKKETGQQSFDMQFLAKTGFI
jgi:riboflavin synthase